jgi:hypothetical protein
MAAKTNEKEVTVCPVAKCWMDFENRFGKKSKFVSHLNQSHIEVLKAIRSLVDERIEDLDRKASPKGKKKMTSIKVD